MCTVNSTAPQDEAHDKSNTSIIVSELGERIVQFKKRDCFGVEIPYEFYDIEYGVTHLICGGTAKMMQVSLSASILLCERCRMRIVFPSNVKTFSQLREHFRRWND